MQTYKIDEFIANTRLDKCLANLLTDTSRTYINKLIEEGKCFVNGKIAKASLKVKIGDEIQIDIPEIKPLEVNSEDIPLDIVYEDSDILIITGNTLLLTPSYITVKI